MNITRRGALRFAVLAGMQWALAGCGRGESQNGGEGQASRTLFYFDTVCTLGGAMDDSVLDEAEELCARYEQLFSRTIATSDVGRINAAKGEPVEVDPLTADLVQKALSYCEASGGLFDITIGAVSELWDFTEGVVPAKEDVAAALPHVGWQNVQVSGNTITLADPLARLDLGGIAKGYIADGIVELFQSRGVTSAYVNLGGNVCVLGTKENGDPWNVGVRDPWDENGQNVVAKMTMPAEGGSMVTSGLYERSFQKGGKRYWHILNPRTGYPVQTDVISATVCSQASIDGDGYTKPLFMLAHDEALAFLQERDGLQGLLVLEGGDILTTKDSGFQLL